MMFLLGEHKGPIAPIALVLLSSTKAGQHQLATLSMRFAAW
jgi:hypothetical protein